MNALHVLERVVGLQVLGWAAASAPDQQAEILVLVNGRPVAAKVTRHARDDVATDLGLKAEVLYGYSVELSAEIWNSSGQLLPVQISAAGVTLDLPHGPDILKAIDSTLSQPPSAKEIEALPPLLAHLQSMPATPQVCAARQQLGPWLRALGWSLEGPWDAPEAVQGHVDRFDELRVEGWARDSLTATCRFSLWHAGRLWEVQPHRFPRPDLHEGDLPHGFALDIPSAIWAVLPNEAVEIKIVVNGQLLYGQSVILDAAAVDARMRISDSTLPKPLPERSVAEQMLALRWMNHALALHGQARLSASAINGLMSRGVAEGLFVAPFHSGLSGTIPLPQTATDSALWQALKALNLSLSGAESDAQSLAQAISAAPHEVKQRLLLAIAPWSCVNQLFSVIFPQISESTWLSLEADHSPWADSVRLPWLLLSHRVDGAVRACERLAKSSPGWLNTECLRWSMEALCGQRPDDLGPDPAWGTVRHALLGAVLCAGSSGERQHDHHLLVSLWTWLAHTDANDPSASLIDVHKVLSHQGLNPGFWAQRNRLGIELTGTLSATLDQVYEAVAPLLQAPPSQWTEVPAPTQALISRWCEQSGAAGREARRIVREWASHLSTTHELSPGHAAVAEWLNRLGPTEGLRWRQAPLVDCAALLPPKPDALAQVYQLPRLSAAAAATPAPAKALRVVWIPEDSEDEAPEDAPGLGRSGIVADWTVWRIACAHSSPDLPPWEARQSLAMRWLRTIAWFVECTEEQAVCILPWSGRIHIPTLQQLLNEDLPAYCGPTEHWVSAPRRPVSLAWDTQISPAPDVNRFLGDPTGCLLTRETATALIRSCASLLAQDLMAACTGPDHLIRLLLAELGVTPHALSHTWLHPQVVEHRRAWDRDQLLPSLTLWPSDSPPSGPSPNTARTLRLLSPAETLQEFGHPDVLVVCVVRNEIVMLPHFLEHYRRLGVTRFIFIDNLSDDGTTALLLAQPDVMVYSANADYRSARYGVTWQLTAMAHHAMGKWVIAVDADELLVVPSLQAGGIAAWLQEVERSGCTALQTPMIDMLPEGALAEADFTQHPPFEAAPYIDTPAVLPWRLGSGQFSNQSSYVSALRHRLVPSSPPNAFTSQKISIFRYQPWIHFAEGLHYASNVEVGKPSAWLAHFKYHAGFAGKVQEEVVRQQHFAQAAEYQIYARMIAETGGIFRSEQHSRLHDCAHPLADIDETL
ncbi:glycosyltransferase family 2 protein [Ideonella sp.]|jgi:hypothetical protein|uniref:glycosyltransferase family 2 protein n=1 Tax=Ideonella sp. TaxID=1929293 RepID=UPI0037BE4135